MFLGFHVFAPVHDRIPAVVLCSPVLAMHFDPWVSISLEAGGETVPTHTHTHRHTSPILSDRYPSFRRPMRGHGQTLRTGLWQQQRDLAAYPRGGWGLPLWGRQGEAQPLSETIQESGNDRSGNQKMQFSRRLLRIWTKRVLADLSLSSSAATGHVWKVALG